MKANYRNIAKHLAALILSKWEILVLCAALLVSGGAIAISTPLGYGNDEMVHAFKGAALSTGQAMPKKTGSTLTYNDEVFFQYGGSIPHSLAELATNTWQAKSESTCSNNLCDKPSKSAVDMVKSMSARSINEQAYPTDFWGANSYVFIPYIPSAIGFGIAHILDTSVGTAIYLARIMNLIICTLLVAFAFHLLNKQKFRWVIFSIALLPSAVFSFGLLGVDGVLNALSLVLLSIISLAFSRQQPSSRVLSFTALGIAIVLPIIKIPYAILSLFILLPNVLHFPKKKLLHYTAISLVILLPALVWNLAVSGTSRTSAGRVHAGTVKPAPSEQLLHVVSNPLKFTETLLKSASNKGILPSTDELTHQYGLKLPADLMVLSAVPLVISTLYAATDFKRSRSNRKYALMLLSACILTVGGIFLALYLTFNPVGSSLIAGVQGRYFIPIHGFIALAVSLFLHIKITSVRLHEKVLFILTPLILLVLTVVWYINIVY